MQTNYFVCTLGQASALSGRPKPYRTIGEFLDLQAKHHAYLPAVGFPIPQQKQETWTYHVLTFGDVHHGTKVFVQRLSHTLGLSKASGTVALLCHSSPEFLFTWLALMKLGYAVLLIAPQCQPAAILHLCRECQVAVLLHDAAHIERARDTEVLAKAERHPDFKAELLPLQPGEDIFESISAPVELTFEPLKADERTTAYLHHTSGTSSGLPKPIPQSHQGALGVLPHLPSIPGIASFTTTPLYHGGIADLFRCWTSNALIWLFPGKDVPITARNICQCLDVAKLYSSGEMIPKVKYFSSVPYVLQMMEADESGLHWLRQMEIVGVGGAALPAEVGDRLVKKGVHLISRFGSAECGFLLSSFRNFATDDDWQYLRNYNPPKLVAFEARDDGLAELVVNPGWPHMAKQNRKDGSFATADLFAPHPRIANAWIYHSRADSQLTLVTGKKFDPAPLEAAIATSPHLDDVLIFGNSRPFPGALLLRAKESSNMSDNELLAVVKPAIEKLNGESQDHARIPFHMLVPMPHQQQALEKSSKGTIIRRVAESRYEDVINQAYTSQEADEAAEVRDEDLPKYLTDMIQSMTSQSHVLNDDTDLFSYGVDSIVCMRLRTRLRRLIPDSKDDLPMSVIEDCGTIRRLAEYVLRRRRGDFDALNDDEEQLMLELVKKYSSFIESHPSTHADSDPSHNESEQTVVLTGATGALGAHILDLLQKSPNVSTIYCLVRGADEHAARERVNKALQQRGLTSLPRSEMPDQQVIVLHAQLSDPHLGLTSDLYKRLAQHATSIVHIAWTVNFRLKLRSFEKDNITGVANLINLALSSTHTTAPRFTYCSSTASIINSTITPLPERILPSPSSASPLGYSRSKWVAEQICAAAHERTRLRGRIAIVRVGQLAGDSVSGVWNTKEAWPMMLSTAGVIGCLPNLQGEVLDWLPVDIAARVFVEATKVGEKRDGSSDGELDIPVYHVLNPHTEPTWQQMLEWLKKKQIFKIVDPQEWVKRLEECDQRHSSLKLLGLWKEASGGVQEETKRLQFDLTETKKRIEVLRDVGPLDEEYVGRMWDWIQANVH